MKNMHPVKHYMQGGSQVCTSVDTELVNKCTSVDTELVNKQALERVDRKRSDHQRRTPATSQTGSANRSDRSDAENAAKPKTASSGGTPLELADLGMSWSRQATQDALERRRDEQRTARDWKN